MKAIILAAGYATRLYPLTIDTPKPLLCVGNKPMLNHIIDNISTIKEIDNIYVITNAKFESKFIEWKNNKNTKNSEQNKNNNTTKITIINDKTTSNEDRLGALGDIQFTINNAKINDNILIVGGDNLFEESLLEMNEFFKKNNSSIIALKDVKDIELAKQFGIVSIDKNNKLTEFIEKPQNPKSTLASAFIYFIKKEDINCIDECLKKNTSGKEVKAGELIAYMLTKTNVYGFTLKKNWFDIGSHEQLKEANDYWKNK